MADPLTKQTIGDVFVGSAYNGNLDLIEDSFTALGPWVISGLVPAAGTGLSVDVTAGTAMFAALLTVVATFTISGLTNTTVNHLYLLDTGAGTSNTTGTAPAGSVKLGTATTAGGVVTAVDITPTSGRQSFTNFKFGRKSVRTVTTNTTVTEADHTFGADTSGGSITFTLPAAATVPGQEFEFKKLAAANSMILDPNGAELIEGAATLTITTLNESITARSTGTAWWAV